MDIIPQIIVSGIAAGGVYGLIALGFVLIYKATSILNLATGEFMTLGAFVCLTVYDRTVGAIWRRSSCYHNLRGQSRSFDRENCVKTTYRRADHIRYHGYHRSCERLKRRYSHDLVSQFGTFPQIFPPTPLDLGFAIVPSGLLWGFIFAVICTVVFTVIFRYTRTGLAMRATAANQQAALSMGISVKRVFALSWSFAAITAAMGGIIIGNISGISIHLGHIGLKVLSVIILGGLDSIIGAIIGGFIIGILENFAGVYLDSMFGGGVKEVVPFIILVLIIMIGLTGSSGNHS